MFSYRVAGKRLLDIVVAVFAIGFFVPFLLIIAAAVLISSGRPIFFVQRRVGLHGCHFNMIKFRTMVVQRDGRGDGQVTGDMALSTARQHYVTTTRGDPRITPVGRFLRKTHLDELPQIVNVLLGQMSLIGPRPDVPVQEADYRPKYWRERCSVKPGISGLAQLQSSTTPRRRLALDLCYVRHVSLRFDVALLFQSILPVFRAKSF